MWGLNVFYGKPSEVTKEGDFVGRWLNMQTLPFHTFVEDRKQRKAVLWSVAFLLSLFSCIWLPLPPPPATRLFLLARPLIRQFTTCSSFCFKISRIDIWPHLHWCWLVATKNFNAFGLLGIISGRLRLYKDNSLISLKFQKEIWVSDVIYLFLGPLPHITIPASNLNTFG